MYNWFTSDWHIGWGRLFEARSSFSSLDEVKDRIFDNLFSQVKSGDNLYFLGDMGKISTEKLSDVFNIFKKHRVNFHWILGNHDKVASSFQHKSLVYIGYMKSIKINDQDICLCHYPMYTWNKSHYNSWNIHGHIHMNDSTYKLIGKEPKEGKHFNVNVEFNDYKAWEFNEIRIKMLEKEDNFDYIKR